MFITDRIEQGSRNLETWVRGAIGSGVGRKGQGDWGVGPPIKRRVSDRVLRSPIHMSVAA